MNSNQSMSIRRFLEGGFASDDIEYRCRILRELSRPFLCKPSGRIVQRIPAKRGLGNVS